MTNTTANTPEGRAARKAEMRRLADLLSTPEGVAAYLASPEGQAELRRETGAEATR